TPETVERITLEDLKEFYARNLSPSSTGFAAAGDIDRKQVMSSLKRLGKKWKKTDVTFPDYALPPVRKEKVFFIDVPGARQSQIVAARLALSAKDDEFNELGYANQILGGGSSGRLFQLLRIEKGFTYGAYSFVSEKIEKAPFMIQTSVRTNATEESLQLIQGLVRDYRKDFGETEMEITRNKVIKGNTRAFESLNSLIGMLYDIFKYDKPLDYVEAEQQELIDMQLADFHRLIEKYIDEGSLIYLIVGDAETQLGSVEALGYGPAVLVDVYGNAIE
ncbi:MAG TPA: insulinase family protein, partial [Candidatus Krumholzibacterium sp.]|nr:insulinase family protein [Candidatus Krumholzibacterium sp.]